MWRILAECSIRLYGVMKTQYNENQILGVASVNMVKGQIFKYRIQILCEQLRQGSFENIWFFSINHFDIFPVFSKYDW